MRHLVLACAIAILASLSAVAADPTPATGAIAGTLTDKKTGDLAIGATVVATSPALVGEQVVITDENGKYVIANLPPGIYTLTVYYENDTFMRANVRVEAGGTVTVSMAIEGTHRYAGEVITISASASVTQAVTRGAPRTVKKPPRQDPSSSTESYDRIDENPYHRVEAEPLSTFSVDVDTAAYANVRRILHEGRFPAPDAVRVEELLNYFHYDDPAPTGPSPFSIATEIGPSPWHAGYKILRIGLRAPAIVDADVPPRNLVFLIDVSGSMESANKLPLLVQSMGLLVDKLRAQDRVSIVTYAGNSGVALATTPGDHKAEIRQALGGLLAGGSTNGGEGIVAAYKLARSAFMRRGINRVILCTDGDFNVGVTSDGELTRLIERERDDGVFLTVLGFGVGNYKDSTMEKLADRGNGNYAYIDTLDEARKVLVKQAGATLVTVAKDVKIQVEMNPATVAGYRLVGYENRKLANEDFNNDAVDAGEIGAGHSVTALYEVIPAGVDVPVPPVDKLRYQVPSHFGKITTELATVKVRYKAPDQNMSKLVVGIVPDATRAWTQTSDDFRWAVSVAGFAMLLRASPYKGGLTWRDLRIAATGAVGHDTEGYRREMLKLVDLARSMAGP